MVEFLSNALNNEEKQENNNVQGCEERQFLIESKEEANKIDNYMSYIFGADYKIIKEIFYHICISEDFQYKILVTRRAYLLYAIFSSMFELSKDTRPPEADDNFQISGTIYNSHSLNLISDSDIDSPENKPNRFLIFDDIVVHGRAISHNYEALLKKGIKDKNISIWCLFRNNDTNCLTEQAEKRITVFTTCNDRKWKKISDVITDIVVRFGQGYTSYIDTYRLSRSDEAQKSDSAQKMYNSFSEVQNAKPPMSITMESLSKFQVKSYVTQTNTYNFNEDEIDCVRFYQYSNDNINDMIVIPYVFFGTIKAEEALSYAVKLLKQYRIEKIPSRFVPKDETELEKKINLAPLLLKWTCNQIGKVLTDRTLSKEKIDFNLFSTVRRKETFGEIEENLISLNDINSKFLNGYTFNDAVSTLENDFCCQTFTQSLFENYECIKNSNITFGKAEIHQLLKNAFTAYSYKIREEDERRAQSQKDRLIGVRVSDIITCINDFLNEHQDLKSVFPENELQNQIILETIALFVDSWDCGSAAYDLVIFTDKDGTKWVSGFMRNGEQVFRSLYDRFSKIYQYYHIYTSYTLKTDTNSLQLFGDYLAKNLPMPLSQQARLFNQYMKFNTSYDSDVFVVAPVGKISDAVFLCVENYVNSY